MLQAHLFKQVLLCSLFCLGKKKKLPRKLYRTPLQELQEDETGCRETDRAQTLLRPFSMKRLWRGSDDGYCVLPSVNAGVDFSFKGQSVEMCF